MRFIIYGIVFLFFVILCSYQEGFKDADKEVFDFYQSQIANRTPPPNAYMNGNMEYSPETVQANTNDIVNHVNQLKKQLPEIVAKCVSQNVNSW
jgi:hypothetical protein